MQRRSCSAVSAARHAPCGMVFSNANYFLNFQKLLGFAKGIKVAQRILLGAMCCGAGTRMCERVRAQLTARGPTGTGSQVDNETSQRQILEMYRKGGAYNGQEIPWDVRKVQPAVEQLEREGVFKGVVLDAGCGFGDNGIFLAQKGYRVVGFDFSPEAISEARTRATSAGVAHLTEWLVADALHLADGPLRDRTFDTVIDSACLQCFDPKTQPRYLDNVRSVLRRGGSFVLLVVCNQSQLRSWCRGVRWMEDHMAGLLTADTGWAIVDSEHTSFMENIPSVKISQGQRQFLSHTESPCLRLIARPISTWSSSLVIAAGAGLAAVAALSVLTLMRRR